ncbi:ATP phosphoribosyltransferase regulatory subunit [Bartonella sp. 11B]|uniref:ATP phosphoribosyltransferase regulatory subunit n=1 Tax=Bartonella sp. 11B TaxID=1933908 RepID=UPI0009C211F1|nr:histidyl-tRNA synthetase [Bartonella sp. 11B]
MVEHSDQALEGLCELEEMQAIFAENGYQNRIKIDPSVVRGLEYYTGPVLKLLYF